MASRADIAVVFAGGEGSRFGGIDKGLIELGGAPLWRRVAGRLAAQGERLAVVSPAVPAWLEHLSGAIWVADPGGGERQGPAAGLLAALQHAAGLGPDADLLTAPIDAPFLPADLYGRLFEARAGAGGMAAIAATAEGLQPAFGLWSAACLGPVRAAFDGGERALHRMAAACRAVACAWPGEPRAFLNINTPDDLARAEAFAGE